jgi:type II secretory pathway predicted ATPase ExeA
MEATAMTTEAHFNLRRMPFERDIPVSALYMSAKMRELLSRLEYVAQKRMFAVVTGDVGIGKTTIMRRFADMLDPAQYRCVYIVDSALRPRVFYWEVLSQLVGEVKPSFYRSECKRKMMSQIRHLLDESNTITVVIIDEAHILSHEMLEETRFLLNNKMDSQNPMALVVVGQSELRQTLSKQVYEPITQRIDFRFKLELFDRAQTTEYIAAHMRHAGGNADIFSGSAIDAVFDYSAGCARKIDKPCSLALHYAAQHGKSSVDAHDVSLVIEQELTW